MIGWDLLLILTHTNKTSNKSSNKSDKNFFKLINNSVYGRTMKNLRKRIKIRVVKNSQHFIKALFIHQSLRVLIGKYLKVV